MEIPTYLTPKQGEYPAYFQTYFNHIGDANPLALLSERLNVAAEFWASISSEKHLYRYAEGKWTVLEVIGHIVDVERILGYRALSIARGETIALPGFDEDAYVATANFNTRTITSLINEWKALRTSNIELFNTFTPTQWQRVGNANGYPISVAALLYAAVGHEVHHHKILLERYV